MKKKYQNKEELSKIENLLRFFTEENRKNGYQMNQHNYIRIKNTVKEHKNLDSVSEETIIIPYGTIQILQVNKTIVSHEFFEQINKSCNFFFFELEYPTDDYRQIY